MAKESNLNDRLLEGILRRCSRLEWSVTASEFKVGYLNQFYGGSIWIRPKKDGYRVQTTGRAQGLDPFIARLLGEADGYSKPQKYQFWNRVTDSQIEKIICEFNRQ